MDQSDLDLNPPPEQGITPKRDNPVRQAGEKTIVWLHEQADRMDLVPTEFGEDQPVDRGDAGSLLKEWRHQARRWAGYNPEQVLALKAGGIALALTLLALVVLVRAIH